MPYDVFISYSWRAEDDKDHPARTDTEKRHPDAELASRLQAALTGEGYDLTVWRDVQQIRSGDVISSALEDAIRDSALVVAILSDLHQSSNVCRWEILSALAQAPIHARIPRVFPVLRSRNGIPIAYPPGVFEADAYAWDGSDNDLEQLCDAIKHQVGKVRAEDGARPSGQQPPRVAGAPGVSGSRFVGRFPDLLHMYARLVSRMAPLDAATRRHRPMLLLHGEPGMGKSSLAAFFAEWFADRFENGVLWLDAAGDRVDARIGDDSERRTVVQSLSAAAERWLRSAERGADVADLPPDPDLRWAELRARIARYLNRAGGRLLLVVDDVPEGITLADLDVSSDQVVTLVTSRSESLAHQGAEGMLIGQFEPFESRLLLTNARDPRGLLRRQGADPWSGHGDEADQLAAIVGHHPMAVDLLGLRLRDPAVSPGALLHEVERNAEEFIDVAGVVLPLQHRGSILATVGGSLRSAVHADPAVASVLRLLAVAPAGRPVRVDALTYAATPSHGDAAPLVEELVGHGLLRRDAGPDGYQVTQHQVIHAVSRELWRRQADPFRPGPDRPQEPDTSYRFARWHHVEGERLRNTDDAKAAETHGVVLHVLAASETAELPAREQALQIAYALLARARLTYRAGTATNDASDYDSALDTIEEAKAVLRPHMDDPAVQFAFHTAEALRGLVLSKGSAAKDGDGGRAARDALDVILAADDARSRIAAVVLAQPPVPGGLDHEYVRDVLARSRFNIPGRAFGIVRALRRDRPDGWVEEARKLLDDAERAYQEVIQLREELWGAQLVDPSRILSQASSQHGIGMVRYYKALLPAGREERLTILGTALPQLLLGLSMRDRGHNETDVCKSLALIVKVLTAAVGLRSNDIDGTLAAQRERWATAQADAERFRGMRLTTDPQSAPLLARRVELRDVLLAELSAIGEDLADQADTHQALQSVVGWLALARVAGVWRSATPEFPDDLAGELLELDEYR